MHASKFTRSWSQDCRSPFMGIPVIYAEVKLDLGFRNDLIAERKVIIEIKLVEAIMPVHKKQLLTYLKLTGIKLGLLINSK